MQAWWGVFEQQASEQEPIAVFRRKDLAQKFSEEYKGVLKPLNIYEDEDDAAFLDNAENIW
jgi:hypothetical protein